MALKHQYEQNKEEIYFSCYLTEKGHPCVLQFHTHNIEDIQFLFKKMKMEQ